MMLFKSLAFFHLILTSMPSLM